MVDDREALVAQVVALLQLPVGMEEVVLDGDGMNGVTASTAAQELNAYLGKPTAESPLFDANAAVQLATKHMAAFIKDAKIQSLGCAVLMKLALDDGEERRSTLLAGSAPAAVAGAMQAHPRERDVLFYALASLVNLGGQDDNLNGALGSAGLATAVVAALEQHFEDKEIQSTGSWAVLSLSVSKKNRDLLSKTSVSESLLNALRNFDSDLEVQLHVLKALSNLTASSRDTKERLRELGVIPLVLRALEYFSHERNVAHAAATAVRNLALHSEKNTTELRAAGAPELLARVYAQYPTDSLVVDAVQRAQKQLQAPPPQACCSLS